MGNEHDHGENTKRYIKDTTGQCDRVFLRESGQGVFSEVTFKLRLDWPVSHEHGAGASAQALWLVCV